MSIARKVSGGVGVDGVGAKFPFLQVSPWPKTEGRSTATAWKCAENTKISGKEKKETKKNAQAKENEEKQKITKKKGKSEKHKRKKERKNTSKVQTRQRNAKIRKFTTHLHQPH